MPSNGKAALLALVLTCSGCASAPVVTRILPPVDLIQDCQEPAGDVSTNGALATYIEALKDALRGCNRDKKALREWAESE